MGGVTVSREARNRIVQLILSVIWVVHIVVTPARAQTTETVARAKPNIEELQRSIEALKKELRKRDALLQSFARRMEKLEQEFGKRASIEAASRTTAKRSVAVSPVGSAELAQTVAFSPQQTTQAAIPAVAVTEASPAAPAMPSTAAPPTPGQFEVSAEAAERALQRTLVATGNLLVPAGFLEVEPLFAYTRREIPNQVVFNVNRNELFPALDARLGLPWDLQLEAALPWNFNEQQTTDIAVSPQQVVSDRWGNAVGDLIVGLAKTFVRESDWVPSLLGRVSWEIPTGPVRANGVPMTSGFDRLSFSATALKRLDPLVFSATGGYTKAFEANRINPGNQFNFITGAFLATSPETTLRAVLSQNFLQDTSVNGITIPGSNTSQPIMTFGASTILGRGLLVDLQVGLGLTNAAPKYQVILSSTYRFGVQGL